MRIDDLQVELRARTPWEAIDLGTAMARRWWRPLGRAWLCLVVPAQLLPFLVLDSPLWAWFSCWWLLPLWERVALFVLSRCLFGVQPTVREVARGLREGGLSGLLGDLSLRRFAATRAIVLPVTQLEHLGGARARQRRRVLVDRVRSTASALALGAWMVEVGALLGLLTLVGWFLPEGPSWSGEVLWDELIMGQGWARAAAATVFVLLSALIQPLRVGAAFGLYLQRRTLLEGWDVELTFRRLAARLARRAAGAASLLVTSLLLLLALPAPPVHAQAPADDAQVRQVTAEVLADPVFGGPDTVTRWKARWELPEVEDDPATAPLSVEVGPLATVLQWALAGLVGAALIGLLLAVLARAPAPPGGDGAEGGPLALARAGLLALDGSPLPDDPARAAWALWQRGQQDAALALLYRAAVAHLVRVRHLEVDDSATEGDCLRAARRTLPARPAAYLARLTRAWQRLAYAHRPVEEAEMRALVEGWPELDAGAT